MQDATMSAHAGQGTGIVTADLATLAERINQEHAACVAAFRSGLQHALEAGRLLLEAKTLCDHGDWAAWLSINFKGSARTAQRYMQVARELPSRLERLREPNATRVADLSFRQALGMVARDARDLSRYPGSADRGEILDWWDQQDGRSVQQAKVQWEAKNWPALSGPRAADPPLSESPELSPAERFNFDDCHDDVDDIEDDSLAAKEPAQIAREMFEMLAEILGDRGVYATLLGGINIAVDIFDGATVAAWLETVARGLRDKLGGAASDE